MRVLVGKISMVVSETKVPKYRTPVVESVSEVSASEQA